MKVTDEKKKKSQNTKCSTMTNSQKQVTYNIAHSEADIRKNQDVHVDIPGHFKGRQIKLLYSVYFLPNNIFG